MAEKRTESERASGAKKSEGTVSRRSEHGVLESEHGHTSIADTVVSKIAGIAAREVSGVHDLGGAATRAMGALRDRVPGARTSMGQGVAVEVGERQTAVDVDLVAEYGVSIVDLAEGVRRNVINSLERMTGLDVIEVNITVHDVHLEGEIGEEESRVE